RAPRLPAGHLRRRGDRRAEPAGHRRVGHPARHLLRAGGRVGRSHRGAGQGAARRRRCRDGRVQPCRERQEPDPQDHRLCQAGAGEGRPDRRRAHDRLPGRRAHRRGSAHRQLGGLPGRRGLPHPRSPHPERVPGRGGARSCRQAAALPQLTVDEGDTKVMSDSVQMPALGESVTEGTVTRWLKNEGDRVEVDEPLLEVSTDKVDTEVPSPYAGVLEKILVQEDETVEVGTDLAIIGSGEGGGDTAPAEQEQPAEEAQAEPVQEEQPAEQEQAPSEQEVAQQAQQQAGSGSSSSGEGQTVQMPALGESVTEGTVTRWLKSEGEQVEVDEPLLEVSTDKVDTEVPSPYS